MEIFTRSAWGARAPKSRTAWNTAALLGACIHWWGIPRAPSSQDGMPALLRGVQNAHMAPGGLGVEDGGSDIAYNFIVDSWGGIWEGRGWATQTGANGTSEANRSYLAIAIGIGTGDVLTEAAELAVNWLIAEGNRRGIGAQVKRHGDFTGTDCPGPAVRAWLGAGRPANDTEEDDVAAKDVWTYEIPGGGVSAPELAQWHLRRQTNLLLALRAELAALALASGAPLDPQAVAEAVIAGLDPTAIAAAVADSLEPELAQQVADELAARLSA